MNYIILIAMLSWYRLRSILSLLKHYYKVIEEHLKCYRYLITLFVIKHLSISVSIRNNMCSCVNVCYCVSCTIWMCACMCVCVCVCVCTNKCVCWIYVCE